MTELVAIIDDHLKEIRASLKLEDIQITDKKQGALKNLMAELQVSKKPNWLD